MFEWKRWYVSQGMRLNVKLQPPLDLQCVRLGLLKRWCVNSLQATTASDAVLAIDQQLRIVLNRIIEKGGQASMSDLFAAINVHLVALGLVLSEQGEADPRNLDNSVGARADYRATRPSPPRLVRDFERTRIRSGHS